MFYVEVHKYDSRYGDKDLIQLHRFKTMELRRDFTIADRKRRKAISRKEALALDKAAFARKSNWFSVNDFHEIWSCDLPVMDKPEPMAADPLTFKQLEAVAQQLRSVCRLECGSYINELASKVCYLVGNLPYAE